MKENTLLNKKAVAIWLVEKTSLTFKQIADFCEMDELKIQGIADGDVNLSIIPQNPIQWGQLTLENIKECEADPKKKLILKDMPVDNVSVKKKKKYIPIARREDKPSAIAFLLKYYPDITNAQIKKLIGATPTMIDSIRNRTRWDINEIVPKDPILLNLCTQSAFKSIVEEIKPKNENKNNK